MFNEDNRMHLVSKNNSYFYFCRVNKIVSIITAQQPNSSLLSVHLFRIIFFLIKEQRKTLTFVNCPNPVGHKDSFFQGSVGYGSTGVLSPCRNNCNENNSKKGGWSEQTMNLQYVRKPEFPGVFQMLCIWKNWCRLVQRKTRPVKLRKTITKI